MAATRRGTGTAESRGRAPAGPARKIRWAVVGQGYISQVAVLPAFEHARRYCELTALFSDDREKLDKLGRKYEVERLHGYDEYDRVLGEGLVDAVYIALPNHLHADFTIRAARAGVHVLCEKPMAVTEEECEQMIEAADTHGVKLMVAYRLHFEPANLEAMEVVRSGKIGEPRIFTSTFCMQVQEGNIRVSAEHGGGSLYDLGVYCINAARYLFDDEPTEAIAFTAARPNDPRFEDVDEMTSAILRYPGDRIAGFTTSFGAMRLSEYRILGTEGHLEVNPAFTYHEVLEHRLAVNGRVRKRRFAKRDQFAPELIYFSKCIVEDRAPEPSGIEGLNDVRIIRALYESARTGQAVKLPDLRREPRPAPEQEIYRPPVREPDLVHAEPPTGR